MGGENVAKNVQANQALKGVWSATQIGSKLVDGICGGHLVFFCMQEGIWNAHGGIYQPCLKLNNIVIFFNVTKHSTEPEFAIFSSSCCCFSASQPTQLHFYTLLCTTVFATLASFLVVAVVVASKLFKSSVFALDFAAKQKEAVSIHNETKPALKAPEKWEKWK